MVRSYGKKLALSNRKASRVSTSETR